MWNTSSVCIYGPQHDKLVFRFSDAVRLNPVAPAAETSYKIKILLVAGLDNDTFLKTNNKGAHQSAHPVWAFVVCKPPRQRFSLLMT